MVAVMTCVCKKTWAASSGQTLADFRKVANTYVDDVAAGGPVPPERLWAANGAESPAKLQEFLDIAEQIDERNKSPITTERQPPVGQCAAAKLFAHAQGHYPASMTERYFSPKRDWKKTYEVRRTVLSEQELLELSPRQMNMVLKNRRAKIEEESFHTTDSGETVKTVASCKTCQETLYMTMCEKIPCG